VADFDKPLTCAICLQPVDEMTIVTVMTTLIAAGRTVGEDDPDRPAVNVHGECIRPVLHPDYHR
jgi:hypothetical protein